MPLHVSQSWLLKNWLYARMIIRKANIFFLSAAGGINRMCNDDKLLNRCVYAEQRIDFFLNVINAHYQATNRITSRKVKLSVMLRQNKEARDLLIVKHFKDQMIKSSSRIFLNGFSGQRSQQWTFTHQGTIVWFDVKYSILENHNVISRGQRYSSYFSHQQVATTQRNTRMQLILFSSCFNKCNYVKIIKGNYRWILPLVTYRHLEMPGFRYCDV